MRYTLSFLFCVLSFSCLAEKQGQARVDSLLGQLNNSPVDSMKVKILIDLSMTYKTIDPNKGIAYGLQLLQFSTRTGSKKGIGYANNCLGLNYYQKSDYVKAIEYFHKALLLFSDAPASGAYSSIISHLAVIYQETGQYEKALEYNRKALAIDIQNADSTNIAGDYGNIGIVYLLQKNYDKAIEYDLKSFDIFKQMNDTDGMAHNYGNIGNVYKEQQNYTQALFYDTKALEMFTRLGDNYGIAVNLGNIGGIYLNVARSLDSVKKGDVSLPSGSRNMFLHKALSYLDSCIDLSLKMGQLENVMEFDHGKYEAYEMLGDHEKALASYMRHVKYKDSIYSEDNKLKIASLETERELALKDKQIRIDELEVAKKRNERLLLTLALVVLLGVVAYILRKFYAQKKHNNQLAQEKKRHLARIEKQKSIMGDIAYTHSHEVSGQVSTILGLVALFNSDNYADADNKVIIDGIGETAEKLDAVVKEMIIKENLLNNSQNQV